MEEGRPLRDPPVSAARPGARPCTTLTGLESGAGRGGAERACPCLVSPAPAWAPHDLAPHAVGPPRTPAARWSQWGGHGRKAAHYSLMSVNRRETDLEFRMVKNHPSSAV